MTRQEGSPKDRGRNLNPNLIKAMPESSIQELDELPPDAAVAADHRNPRRRNREAQQEDEPEVGVLVQPGPRHELGGLILHRGVKQQILDGLRAIQIRDQLEEVWSISRLQPQQGRWGCLCWISRRRGGRACEEKGAALAAREADGYWKGIFRRERLMATLRQVGCRT